MRLLTIRARIKQMALIGLLTGLVSLAAPAAVYAQQAVAQAYGISKPVQNGMIVMLDSKKPTAIEPLTNKTESAMQGVVISASDSAVSLGGDNSTDQAYVATAGKYNVLVSDQNGRIRSGDFIAISSLDGIGMKASSQQQIIAGKALANFDGTGNVSGTAQLQTSSGTKNVAIGLIQVDVGISHNPLASGSGADASVPSILRDAAQNITGKPAVSAPRIYIGIVILLVTFAIVGSLLYSGVRSSLGAIGRNPLAKRSILGGLMQVMIVGLTIFVIGLVAIYLVLKL